MDSRYQWDEAIVGVSLGMDSIMYSTPNSSANGGNDVDIFIPRRSIRNSTNSQSSAMESTLNLAEHDFQNYQMRL